MITISQNENHLKHLAQLLTLLPKIVNRKKISREGAKIPGGSLCVFLSVELTLVKACLITSGTSAYFQTGTGLSAGCPTGHRRDSCHCPAYHHAMVGGDRACSPGLEQLVATHSIQRECYKALAEAFQDGRLTLEAELDIKELLTQDSLPQHKLTRWR